MYVFFKLSKTFLFKTHCVIRVLLLCKVNDGLAVRKTKILVVQQLSGGRIWFWNEGIIIGRIPCARTRLIYYYPRVLWWQRLTVIEGSRKSIASIDRHGQWKHKTLMWDKSRQSLRSEVVVYARWSAEVENYITLYVIIQTIFVLYFIAMIELHGRGIDHKFVNSFEHDIPDPKKIKIIQFCLFYLKNNLQLLFRAVC